MPRYVALLRGINVGGKNLIRMPALKAAFEAAGFEDVSTYIQSGNVLFSSPSRSAKRLTEEIEALLAEPQLETTLSVAPPLSSGEKANAPAVSSATTNRTTP